MIQVLPSERCLHVPFFSHLSLLCNPSPLLPRYHSSSPCKLSCSEPQRTLLSVELRTLSFFNMLASMFLVFCFAFPPFHAFFSNLFLRFSYGFSRVSFLQFPHFPSGFPQFSLVFPSLPFIFSFIFMFFFNIFLHFPPFFATLRHSFLGITPRPLANRPCSEPQRTLLSVEVRILSFFQYACLYVPSFFALPFLHFMPFFQTFSCVFLQFFKSFLPAISSFSQRFPQFSLVFPSLPFIFSFIFMFFSTFSSIFLHFLQPFATPSSASLLVPLQTVLLRTPTDAALRWGSDP